jgi:hypothetical protein
MTHIRKQLMKKIIKLMHMKKKATGLNLRIGKWCPMSGIEWHCPKHPSAEVEITYTYMDYDGCERHTNPDGTDLEIPVQKMR